MQEYVELSFQYLNQGWVGSILGIVGILVGCATSYYFYRKAERSPRPTAIITSFRLADNHYYKLDGLDVAVTYHGKPIPLATFTTVRFWNAGNATLDGESVAPMEPIRLELPKGAEFLTASVQPLPRPATNVQVAVHPALPNVARITFDFLDPDDGAVLALVHTAESDAIEVKGVIKGIPAGVVVKRPNPFQVIVVDRGPVGIRKLGNFIGMAITGLVLWGLDFHMLTWAVLGWLATDLLFMYIKKPAFPKSLISSASPVAPRRDAE